MVNIMWRRFNVILILLLMTLLASCSSHLSRGDGPPNYYVDESKIPNAVPKPEPLAKYGNLTSYRVFGQRYYTLKSSKNYQAVGIASWYGTKFHERRTSSGEPYDMLGMTAAHKTLPLPTYLQVTNLKNHRQVIVKVNDRGPFASNRILDLSYVAAKKLGMMGKGTALVKIKALDPYTYGKASAPQKWQHGNQSSLVYLQVGAFRTKLRAEKLRQRLIAMFDETPIHVAKGKLYQVRIGPIKDQATANKITHQLRNLGMKPNKTYG